MRILSRWIAVNFLSVVLWLLLYHPQHSLRWANSMANYFVYLELQEVRVWAAFHNRHARSSFGCRDNEKVKWNRNLVLGAFNWAFIVLLLWMRFFFYNFWLRETFWTLIYIVKFLHNYTLENKTISATKALQRSEMPGRARQVSREAFIENSRRSSFQCKFDIRLNSGSKSHPFSRSHLLFNSARILISCPCWISLSHSMLLLCSLLARQKLHRLPRDKIAFFWHKVMQLIFFIWFPSNFFANAIAKARGCKFMTKGIEIQLHAPRHHFCCVSYNAQSSIHSNNRSIVCNFCCVCTILPERVHSWGWAWCWVYRSGGL